MPPTSDRAAKLGWVERVLAVTLSQSGVPPNDNAKEDPNSVPRGLAALPAAPNATSQQAKSSIKAAQAGAAFCEECQLKQNAA